MKTHKGNNWYRQDLNNYTSEFLIEIIEGLKDEWRNINEKFDKFGLTDKLKWNVITAIMNGIILVMKNIYVLALDVIGKLM